MGRTAWLLSAAVLWLAPQSGHGSDPVGEGRLYRLPELGSYQLPVIARVSPHELVSASGEPRPVLGLEPGQCAVVSFMYTGCSDSGGCPLVLASLRRVDREIAARSDLADRVQLVSVSFDPEHDTPERLAMLRKHLDPRGRWHFLTAESEAQLRPVLEDYGQDAVALVAADNGQVLGVIRHIAKVFLIDDERRIRNIYSSGFLDHEILLRDIETLLLAEKTPSGGD